jgi:hypothetical protein
MRSFSSLNVPVCSSFSHLPGKAFCCIAPKVPESCMTQYLNCFSHPDHAICPPAICHGILLLSVRYHCSGDCHRTSMSVRHKTIPSSSCSRRCEVDRLKSIISLQVQPGIQAEDTFVSVHSLQIGQHVSPTRSVSKIMATSSMTEEQLLTNLSLVTNRAASLSASLPSSPQKQMSSDSTKLQPPTLDDLRLSLRESLTATQLATGLFHHPMEAHVRIWCEVMRGHQER